jgi:hypothetical protein
MDDLISRQAAIDALKELTANGTNKGMVFGEDAVHRIEMLPSAQPDIIRCPDCYYNDGTAYCELHFRNVKAKDFCSWAERRRG